MKVFGIIKTIVFGALGILLICFRNFLITDFTEYIHFIVGAAMVLFGCETFGETFFDKNKKDRTLGIIGGSVTLLFGLVVLTHVKVLSDNMVLVCVLWGVASILREIKELLIFYKNKFKTNPFAVILNLVYSVVVIVFSIILILNPVIEKVKTHLLILGIEMILEAALPFIYKLGEKIRK